VASGVEYPHVIDVIARDSVRRVVTLKMIESRPWSDSDLQLFQLQEKFNAYLAFALDGEMTEAYPEFADHQIRLELNCPEPPIGRTLQLLTMVREQIAFRGVDLEVIVTGATHGKDKCECDSGCETAAPAEASEKHDCC
jgi:hypothetical protein